MTFDDAIGSIHTEARAMVSQCQTAGDHIFAPVLRFKNAAHRIYEDRQAGCRIAICEERMVNLRTELEWLAQFGFRRGDLHSLVITAGERFLGWTWPDGRPTLPETLPEYR
jgi:hypothetical protein